MRCIGSTGGQPVLDSFINITQDPVALSYKIFYGIDIYQITFKNADKQCPEILLRHN